MSAWVVTSHHIDLLVSAAVERGIAVKFAPIDEAVPATIELAEQIGLLLWAENIRSVIYRYRLDGTEEETGYLQTLAEYHFRFYPGVRAAAAQKALDCFDYQACECPDYQTTAAAFVVKQLEAALGARDEAAYEREPWGFDTSEAVIAAQDVPPWAA
jgi:hypothetical protein